MTDAIHHRAREASLTIPSGPGELYDRITKLREEYRTILKGWTSEHDFLLHLLERGLPEAEQELRRMTAPSLVLPNDVPPPRSNIPPR